jgi:hypothetical protein
MRAALFLSVVFGAGCASTRSVEAPAPYDSSGFRVEVGPRVRTCYGFQQIRGTVRNDTETTSNVAVVLYLFGEGEESVGQAFGLVPELGPGETSAFEAHVYPWFIPDPAAGGGETTYVPLPFSRVEPGYVLAVPPSGG